MHPQMLARRQLDAQNRIMAATSTLAEKFSVEAPATINQRQADIAQMLRWEAVAAFLDNLTGAHAEKETEEAVRIQAEKDALRVAIVEEVLAIEGLSKTSIKTIEEHFKPKEGSEDAQT